MTEEPDAKLAFDQVTQGAGSQSPISFNLESTFAEWDRYDVLRFIAKGGMGRVYMARDRELGRLVALKFLNQLCLDAHPRFLEEARQQARLQHPNICPIYEVGIWSGVPYLAMRYIDGNRLDQASAHLSIEAKVLIIQKAALALEAAHRMHLVHRDIKPANILLELDGDGILNPIIVDFGLVRDLQGPGITQSNMFMGTIGFSAPEQLQGSHEADRRSDVFSLGATLYFLLTAHLPYEHPGMDPLKAQLIQDPVSLRIRLPQISRDLESVVLKALEREPGQRYQTAAAFAEDLGRYLSGEPVRAQRHTFMHRLRRHVSRHPALSALTVLAVLVASSGAALAVRARVRERHMLRLAQDFGATGMSLDLELRMARMRPPHDQSEILVRATSVLQSLHHRMTLLGPSAAGPGHAAIGRGYYALREFDAAIHHLQMALRAGLETPEVHQLLGQSMAWKLSTELSSTMNTLGKHAFETRKKNLEATLMAPALKHLEQGARGRSQDLLEPHVQMLRGNHQQALSLVETLWKQDPGLYEAMLLKAEIHGSQGRAHEKDGRFAEADRAYSAALEALETARTVARADFHLELETATFWYTRFRIKGSSGQRDAALFKACQTALDRAATLHPNASVVHHLRGNLLIHDTGIRITFNEGPRRTIEASLRMADEQFRLALQRDPNLFACAVDRGNALCMLSEFVADSESRALAEEGLAILETAAKKDAASLHVLDTLARGLDSEVRRRRRCGEPFFPTLKRSVEVSATLTSLDPNFPVFLVNQGAGYLMALQASFLWGEPPLCTELAAFSCFEKALKQAPDFHYATLFYAQGLLEAGIRSMENSQQGASTRLLQRMDSLLQEAQPRMDPTTPLRRQLEVIQQALKDLVAIERGSPTPVPDSALARLDGLLQQDGTHTELQELACLLRTFQVDPPHRRLQPSPGEYAALERQLKSAERAGVTAASLSEFRLGLAMSRARHSPTPMALNALNRARAEAHRHHASPFRQEMARIEAAILTLRHEKSPITTQPGALDAIRRDLDRAFNLWPESARLQGLQRQLEEASLSKAAPAR